MTASDLHGLAMGAHVAGNHHSALEYELAAIERMRAARGRVEPSWSILHSSAANLAVLVGDLDLAGRLRVEVDPALDPDGPRPSA